MTATYDPTKVSDEALNRIRFELGDTDPEGAELQDEEISAVLEASEGGWQEAAARLARVVHRRYARLVNFQVGPVKFDYDSRAKAWGALADRLESGAPGSGSDSALHAVPSAGGIASEGGNYFRTGMHDYYGS